jgi:hypothetical protein
VAGVAQTRKRAIQVGRPAAGGGLDLGTASRTLPMAPARAQQSLLLGSAFPSPVLSRPPQRKLVRPAGPARHVVRNADRSSGFSLLLPAAMQCMRSIRAPLVRRLLLRGSQQAPLGISRTRSTVTHTARPSRRRHGVLFGSSALLRHRRGCGRFIFQSLGERTLPVVVYFPLACAPCLY